MSRWPDWRRRMPRILGVTLFLLGVVCVIEAFSGAFRRAIDPARGIIDSIVLPTNGNLAYAAFVFLLAAAIARRKRVAWRILVFLMWLQVVGGLVVEVFVLVPPGVLCPRPPREPPPRPRRHPRAARLLRYPPRQVGRLLPERQGGGDLPR